LARLLLALFVFLAGVSGGAYWLLVKRGKSAHHGAVNQGEALNKSEASGSDQFFYGAIGGGDEGELVAAPAAAEAGKPEGRVSYTLELLVTTDRAEAEALIDQLKAKGVEAYYTPLSRAGRVVYRVRRGMFTNRKDADRAAGQLKLAAAHDAKVIKLQ
jgi:hypothetical protein